MTMYALTTKQGTVIRESALCAEHNTREHRLALEPVAGDATGGHVEVETDARCRVCDAPMLARLAPLEAVIDNAEIDGLNEIEAADMVEPARAALASLERDARALWEIQGILNGAEWDADVLEEISAVFLGIGVVFEGPDDYCNASMGGSRDCVLAPGHDGPHESEAQ